MTLAEGTHLEELVFSSEFYGFSWVLFFPKGQKHLLVPSHEVMKCCFYM